MSLVEDGRDIRRTSPSACWKSRYNSRSDTAADHARPPKAADHRRSAASATFWNPAGAIVVSQRRLESPDPDAVVEAVRKGLAKRGARVVAVERCRSAAA